MSIEVKYAVANNSKHAKEPKNATIVPQVTPIMIELKIEIPCRYFGKVYHRSSLQKNYFVSCDAGVIDSDFCGTVLILLTNNSKDPILIKAGQRITQIVFHKKEVVFKKVACLSSTESGA